MFCYRIHLGSHCCIDNLDMAAEIINDILKACNMSILKTGIKVEITCSNSDVLVVFVMQVYSL